jgi:tRNA 2-thiouridine synthesizing protein E
MAYDFNGKQIATTQSGYLENFEDWTEELAIDMAKTDGIELSVRHWDLIKYLRDEFAGGGSQPNTRNIVKAMSKSWNEKLSQKDVYVLFNGDPSKIAGKYAGVAESKRKGGY